MTKEGVVVGIALAVLLVGSARALVWVVNDIKQDVAGEIAKRDLCFSAGYSEIKGGWCIKGIDAPVLVESLRGES